MILYSAYALFDNNIISIREGTSNLGLVYTLRVNGSVVAACSYADLAVKDNSLLATIGEAHVSESSVQLKFSASRGLFKPNRFTLLIDGNEVELIESPEAKIEARVRNAGYAYEEVAPAVFGVEDVRAQLAKNENKKRAGRGKKIALALISMLAFAIAIGVLALSGDDPIPIAMAASYVFSLTIAVLIHELGHFLAMRYFGFRDLNMLFVPFIGAMVSGKKTAASRRQVAITYLMGPIPGLVLALLLAGVDNHLAVDSTLLKIMTFVLLLVNGLNLLPILPLDGGRFLQEVLFYRSRLLVAGFGFISVALLMFSGLTQIIFADSLWGFAPLVFAAIVGLGTWEQFRHAAAASEIKLDCIDGATPLKALSEISDDDLSRILERAEPLFTKRTTLEERALAVELIVEGSRPPLGIGVTLVLLSVYLLSWVAIVIVSMGFF